MNYKIFGLLTVLGKTTGLFASQQANDEIMWKNAYRGNFSIVHKLALTRPANNCTDDIMTLFVLAYSKYKLGYDEDLTLIYKSVDNYIENILIEGNK